MADIGADTTGGALDAAADDVWADGGLRCEEDEQCEDGNPCTDGYCGLERVCVYPPQEGACDDRDPCTRDDTCIGGVCQGTQVSCPDDGDPCTAETCIAGEGCGYVCSGAMYCVQRCQTDGECDDDDPTSVDICVVGLCSSVCTHFWPACDDDNPCTADRPDADGECHNFPLSEGVCDDGSACTTEDLCLDGDCVGTPVVCDDGNPCTEDGCDPAGGCVAVAYNDGTPCNDGDACTVRDECRGGVCMAETRTCPDDGDPCSIEYCDSSVGCTLYCRQTDECAPECVLDSDCADTDPCTLDRCDANSCSRRCTHGVDPCDDGDPCTFDECVDGVGCDHLVVCRLCTPETEDEDCDDGDPCTVGVCHSDSLCAQTPVECPPVADPCAVSRCAAGVGCVVECAEDCPGRCETDEECDDGDFCTVETCVEGECGGFCRVEPLPCEPPGPCGVAVCAAGGCVDSVPVAAPTLDGSVEGDWHPGALGAVETEVSTWPEAWLEELHVQIDDNLLYVGVRGVAPAEGQAIVGYLDLDLGTNSGVEDLARDVSGGSGELDAALSGCALLNPAGFGADVAFGTVAMGSAYGASEFAGWRRFTPDGTLRWMVEGAVVADVEHGGVEATIPLSALFADGVPEEGAALALVVLLTDAGAGGCSYANQTLPNQPGEIDPVRPIIITGYQFAIQPSLWGCCVEDVDCRDNDPCTRDVCAPGGVCTYRDTDC